MSAVHPTTYVVNTRFQVMRNVPGLQNVGRQVQGLNRSFNNLVRSAALIGFASGIVKGTRALITMQTEIQNAEVGIGSIISALTKTDMTKSLRAASNIVKELRKDATKAPGELADFAQGFQQILAPVLSAGGTLGRARELNRLALLAGSAINPDRGLKTLPIDVTQALTQGVGARTTRDLNIALRAISVSNEEFNEMTRPERLETLERAFGTFSEAALVMGRTWDAQAATLKDNIKEIARTITRPLFQTMTDQLINVNNLMDKNNAAITIWADTLSNRVLRTYDDILRRGPQIARVIGVSAGGLGGAGVGALGGRAVIGLGAGPAAGAVAALAFIGAAVSNAAIVWPKESKSAAASLMELGNSLFDFGAGLTTAVLNTDIVLGASLDMIVAVDTFSSQLTRLVDIVDSSASTMLGIDVPTVPFLQKLRRFSPILSEDQVTNSTAMNRMLEVVELGTRGFEMMTGKRPLPFPFSMNVGPLEERDPLTPMGFKEAASRDFHDFGADDILPVPPVVNLNGPITIVVRATRVDNPDLAARSLETAMKRLSTFRVSGRSTLQPRPM